jgi:hypothetical protein
VGSRPKGKTALASIWSRVRVLGPRTFASQAPEDWLVPTAAWFRPAAIIAIQALEAIYAPADKINEHAPLLPPARN